MPVPAHESLATLDTTHSYFTDAELTGEKTRHLHGALITQQNQELRVSWFPVVGSGSHTGPPFFLVGTTANTSTLDFHFTGLVKKITIC